MGFVRWGCCVGHAPRSPLLLHMRRSAPPPQLAPEQDPAMPCRLPCGPTYSQDCHRAGCCWGGGGGGGAVLAGREGAAARQPAGQHPRGAVRPAPVLAMIQPGFPCRHGAVLACLPSLRIPAMPAPKVVTAHVSCFCPQPRLLPHIATCTSILREALCRPPQDPLYHPNACMEPPNPAFNAMYHSLAATQHIVRAIIAVLAAAVRDGTAGWVDQPPAHPAPKAGQGMLDRLTAIPLRRRF